LGGVSQKKKLAPIGTRGNGSLLKRSPIRTWRETIEGFNEETLPHTFFFIAGDALDPIPPHGRHLEESGHVLAVRPVELHAAVPAAVVFGVFALVEIAAHLAKLGRHQSAFHPSRRKDAACHAVLPTLVVDDIPGTEFPEGEESRSLDDMRLFA
jgi:hypothetical protein